jgi:hypothetical protein
MTTNSSVSGHPDGAAQDHLSAGEERADECFESLGLLRLNWNVAVWASLVGGIQLVEQEIARRGDNTPHLDAALLNLSRFIPVAMKWAIQHGRPASTLAGLRWTESLATKVNEALGVASQYSSFLTCLPMWHKDRYAAELITPTLVRFTAPGTSRDRQVSAYQKSFRPTQGDYKGQRANKTEQGPRMQELFAQVFRACRKTGRLRFEYTDPWDLWGELLPEYQARVAGLVRRADSLSRMVKNLKHFEKAWFPVS